MSSRDEVRAETVLEWMDRRDERLHQDLNGLTAGLTKIADAHSESAHITNRLLTQLEASHKIEQARTDELIRKVDAITDRIDRRRSGSTRTDDLERERRRQFDGLTWDQVKKMVQYVLIPLAFAVAGLVTGSEFLGGGNGTARGPEESNPPPALEQTPSPMETPARKGSE